MSQGTGQPQGVERPHEPARRSGPPGGLVLLAAFAVVVPLLWIAQGGREQPPGANASVEDLAEHWAGDRLQEVRYHPASGPDLGEDLPAGVARETQRIASGLTTAERDVPATVVAQGEPERAADGRTRQRLHVTWDLGEDRRWEYDTAVELRLHEGTWLPVWTPSVVHPSIIPGLVLATQRVRPTREQVVGAGEQVLTTNRAVLEIGIRPGRADGEGRTAREVARILGMDEEPLVDRVRAADDEVLVVARTLAPADCRRCAELRAVQGVEIRQRTVQAPAQPGVAPSLLGEVRTADEELRRLDVGRIATGDVVGVSGLQRTYDQWLAGTAGVEVRAVPSEGSSVVAPAEPLFIDPPVPGRPLRVSLDAVVQRAAEGAVAGARTATTVVTVDVGSGDVTSVVTRGASTGGDRGLTGRVPPGGVFAPVPALALLRAGVAPETPVECPPILDVAGQRYTTTQDPAVRTFGDAVVRGCRTALAELGGRVSGAQLREAGQMLGYGRADLLGASAFRGDVPVTADPVRHTSSVLGEGEVLASPFVVARAAATVANEGAYVPSRLVLSPEPASSGGVGEGPAELDEPHATALATLMRRSVVEDGGTAHALAAVPGEVAAIAGSASYGPDGGVRHVWTTGYRGDTAFAVLVEASGADTAPATDVAAELLRALPPG